MKFNRSRRFSSTTMAVFIIFSTFAVMNFTSMNVSATDYDEYSNLVIDRAIWNESDTITLHECNLIIEDGGILTYNDSVVLEIISDNPGDNGIIIEPGGKFIINSASGNTIIKSETGNEWKSYTFTNSGTIDFLGATVERVFGDPDNSEMGGIINNPGSVCELDNCKFYDADTHGICVDNSNLTLKGANTRICPMDASENDGSGIWIKGNSNVSIEQITINNTQGYGIKCVDVDNVTIKNGVMIDDCGSDGIFVENSKVVIKGSTVEFCNGVGVNITSDSNVTIESSSVIKNCTTHGVLIDESVAMIKNSIIQNNTKVGIIVQDSTFSLISDNNISYNQKGVYIFDADNIQIRNNDIYYNNVNGLHLQDSNIVLNMPLKVGSSGFGEAVDFDNKAFDGHRVFDNGIILLKLKPLESPQLSISDIREDIEKNIEGKIIRDYHYSGISVLKLTGEKSTEKAIRQLSKNPNVLYAEPNYIMRSASTYPNDTHFDWLWGLNNTGQSGGTINADIDAPEAWDITTGSGDIVVAVIDGGIDYFHQDLIDNIWTNPNESIGDANGDGYPGIKDVDDDGDGLVDEDSEGREPGDPGYLNDTVDDDDENGYNDDIYGIDAINDDSDPFDTRGHGTHCAGTIGAVGNNSLNITGVNWNVSMMAIQWTQGGLGTLESLIESIEYMIIMKENGINIRVCSNSGGGAIPFSQALYDAIAACRYSNILYIVAAMNDGKNIDYFPYYPASFNLTNIISVAASDHDDELATFPSGKKTNYGASNVDVSAPGKNIFSTLLDNTTGNKSGTSMATPHVSGLAALLSSTNSSWNYNNIKNLILSSVEQKSSLKNKLVTEGRINANDALTYNSTDMQLFVHSPGNNTKLTKEQPVEIVVSLNNGSQPITNASVNISFSSGESNITLADNGVGVDQVTYDGYYSGNWYPQNSGYIYLNITATADGYNSINKNLTVYVIYGNTIVGNEIIKTDLGVLWPCVATGIYLYCSNYNLIKNNYINSTQYYGVQLYSSNCNELSQNSLSSNNHGILVKSSSHNNFLSSNIVTSTSTYGIAVIESNNNTIWGNILSNNAHGVRLLQGFYNNIESNIIESCNNGIELTKSSINIINYNEISLNDYGINLDNNSDTNSIYHNNIINNSCQAYDSGANNSWDNGYPSGGNYWDDYNGTDMNYGPNQNYTGPDGFGDTPYNSSYGQGIGGGSSKDNYPLMGPIIDGRFMKPSFRINSDADFVTKSWIAPTGNGSASNPWIIENYYINGSGKGSCIYVGNTTNNFTIRNSKLYDASGNSGLYYWNSGIGLYNVTNVLVENNMVEDADNGIYIRDSNMSTIQENTATSNSYGFYLYGSDNITLEDNSACSNSYTGIYLYSSENNTIFLNNVSMNIDSGIHLYYCNYNSLTGNAVNSNNDSSIYLSHSSHNSICNNTANSNTNASGIHLYKSSYNTIFNNTANLNDENGIYLHVSTNCVVDNNTVSSSDEYGIYLRDSNTGDITSNIVSQSSDYGLKVYSTDTCLIFGNSFNGNNNGSCQAYDDGTNNFWDNGYPNGGNYWSDYNGIDIYGGSGQNLSGSDGIGDWPYNNTGTANSKDNYPIMNSGMNNYFFWAKSIGGINNDYLLESMQTSDGGYIVAGYTYSAGIGNYDGCVIKFYANSTIEWQKAYGGSGDDRVMTIQQTDDDGDGERDDGYIVGGYTSSFGGSCEYWIFKLYPNGTIEWSERCGHAYNWDASYSIRQTDDDEDGKQDDGYIVAGYTRNPTAGVQDYWILKLFQNGTIDWQKHYGGTGEDIPFSIEQTDDDNDGNQNDGFIIAGRTKSFGASGYDYWVIKLSETGNITWQKRYGGSSNDLARQIEQTSDGGYILAGYTQSFTEGGYDIWVLKLDANGSIEWENSYGNSSSDGTVSIQETSDSGFIIGGWTNSYGAGGADAWILKLNATGSIEWQKAYGGSSDDFLSSISLTSDGGYIVTGYTTTFGAGNNDIWVLKLGPNGELTFDYGSGASVTVTNTTAVASTCTVTNTSSTVGSVSHSITAVSATTINTTFSLNVQATYSYGWY